MANEAKPFQPLSQELVDMIFKRVELSKEAGMADVPGYSSADTDWTEEELVLVTEGLQRFPARAVSNLTLYVQIASTLPRKTVRDVAARVHSMKETAKQKGQRKRARAPPEVHNSAAEPVLPGMMAGKPLNPGAALAASALNATSQRRRPLRCSDPRAEVEIKAALEGNAKLMGKMRENMMLGRFEESGPCMVEYYGNLERVKATLVGLDSSLPALPIDVDTFFYARATAITGMSGPSAGVMEPSQRPPFPPPPPPHWWAEGAAGHGSMSSHNGEENAGGSYMQHHQQMQQQHEQHQRQQQQHQQQQRAMGGGAGPYGMMQEQQHRQHQQQQQQQQRQPPQQQRREAVPVHG